MNPSEARSLAVRKVVAEVAGVSVAGVKPETRFRQLNLTGSQEDEISWRIRNLVGIEIRPLEWSGFVSVRNLLEFVETAFQEEVSP